MSTKKALAVIAGAGPGTGQAVALRFSKLYNIILLARSPNSYADTLQKIQADGGSAHGIATDITDEDSVRAAFTEMESKFPGVPLAAGVYNVGSMAPRAPFLELKVKDLRSSFEANTAGAFIFAQSCLPRLLDALKKSQLEHPPTLIFTGATASVKASPQFQTFSPNKFALRALTQGLAKEFGPQGVHVGHVIIDGIIDIEKTKEWMKDVEGGKINPNDIAEAYYQLHVQPKTAWTWEMDLRPAVEKW